jgi:hypothetical protein
MLEYKTFREILESRFGLCTALSLIGFCIAIGTNFTFFTINEPFNLPISMSLFGWVLFVWFLACTLSGNISNCNDSSFVARFYKKLNPMEIYHYWSIWWAIAIFAISIVVCVANLHFFGINSKITTLSLVYLGLYSIMNYQEYCFKNSTKKLIARFFISRLFLGYITSVCGVLVLNSLSKAPDINTVFDNLISTKFIIGMLLIILGIVAMFFNREISSLVAALVLLLFATLILLQLPTLFVYFHDPSKVKDYYKMVFLTWQTGTIFGLSFAAGLTMLIHWHRNVR